LELGCSSAEPEVGGSGANALLARIRESLCSPHINRLLAWSVVLLAFVVALRAVFGRVAIWQSASGHVLLETSGVLLACGIIYCLWVQYCLLGERWILLVTIAFGGLVLGGLFHTLSLAFALGGSSALQKLAPWCAAGCKAASACALVFAARSTAVYTKQDCRKIGLRTLVGLFVLPGCLIALALKVMKAWPQINDALSGIPAVIMHHLMGWEYHSLLANLLFLAILLAAFTAFSRRYSREEDAFSEGVIKYLLLSVIGQTASLISTDAYGLCWWASHLFGIAALLILLIKLGAEFGASYANAHARIEHLEAVHYMSSRLSNTLDLRVVLLALVSDTAGMLSARFASVMLADDTGEALTTVVTHGLPEDLLSPIEPQAVEGSGRPGFYSGHTARAFREKRVCVVDDVYTDIEFVPWRLLAQCDGYTVSVPLAYQEIPLGVMNLFFDRHIPLNDERIRLFQTLASSATAAIVNAQLYSKGVRGKSEEVPWLHNIRLAS